MAAAASTPEDTESFESDISSTAPAVRPLTLPPALPPDARAPMPLLDATVAEQLDDNINVIVQAEHTINAEPRPSSSINRRGAPPPTATSPLQQQQRAAEGVIVLDTERQIERDFDQLSFPAVTPPSSSSEGTKLRRLELERRIKEKELELLRA